MNRRRRAVARPIAVRPTISCASGFEVLVPSIGAGVEETNQFQCLRVDRAQVGPLVIVTVMTGPRAVSRVVWTFVLLGNDVFDVEAIKVLILLAQSTILAPSFCTVTDCAPQF